MGVKVISAHSVAVLYDSVTDIAFGPVIYDKENMDAEAAALAFLEWLPLDARRYSPKELSDKYCEWITEQDIQAKNEQIERDAKPQRG